MIRRLKKKILSRKSFQNLLQQNDISVFHINSIFCSRLPEFHQCFHLYESGNRSVVSREARLGEASGDYRR